MATLLDIVKKGSTDRSVTLRIIDSTSGAPETGVAHDTAGLALWYRREGGTVTALTESTLAATDSAHSDGGMKHLSDGEYRVDLPDAAFATGANYVDVGGTVTGMIVIGGRVRLVNVDIEDAVRAGLTALPNAAADAAGGLPISDAGGLDMDDLKADVTAILADTGTDGVVLANDAITAAKFDESTAFPLKSADTGSTAVARTGADSDTLETLSDQIDGVVTGVADVPTNAELTSALADLPTNAELTSALAAADDAVLLAIADVPTNAELASALADLPTNAELTSALADLPTNAELTSALAAADDAVLLAIADVPTNAELTSALADLPTNAELTSALADLPTNAELTSALADLPTNAELTSALADLPTNAELATALESCEVVGIDATTANKLADHILRRSYALARASANGDTLAFRSLLGGIAKLVNAVEVDGTDLLIKHEDDSTTFGTQAITSDADAEPITGLNTT